MRRALLTATAKPSLAFGNPATAGNIFQNSQRLSVDGITTCPGSGTLTTVNFYAATATTITVYVGTLALLSGSTYQFTIRSLADVTCDASGAQTASLSLPVVAGDYFAVWTPVSVAQMGTNTRGPWYQSIVARPTSGTVNVTLATGSLCANLA